MLHVRFKKRMLWALVPAVVLPALWVLQIEVTYQHNIRHGIPADFSIHHRHVVPLWKV